MTPINTSGAPLRAFIYSRFSAEMQSRRSAEDQERENRRFAEREGWVVVGAERDEAVRAGATAGRLGYQRVLAAARDGLFDVLVVEELSRFSRDFLGGIAALAELKAMRVRLADTKNGIVDLESPEGQFRVAFGLVSSQAETKRLGERSKRGQTGKVLQRFSAGGHPPYGYQREAIFSDVERDVDGRPKRIGVRFVEDPIEGPIVRRIHNEYDSGISKHQIARGLNEDGIPTKRANGSRLGKANSGTWSAAAVKGILENEIYIGLRIWNRTSRTGDKLRTGKKRQHANAETEWERVENFAPALVEADLWERVQNRLREDRAKWSAQHNARKGTKYLLSGLIFCGGCGANFVIGETRQGVPHYRCSFRTRGDTVCSNRISLPQPALEARVTGALDVLVKDPTALAELVARHNQRVDSANEHQLSTIRSLEARREQLVMERDNIGAAIATGSKQSKTLVELVLQREEQIVAVETRIEESRSLLQPLLMPRTAAVRDYITGDASIFQGDLARDKEFLTRVLEGIFVSADGAIVMRFRDDTLFARVAAYEFRTDSPAPTGPRDRRRRDHLWDTSVFGWKNGHGQVVAKEIAGAVHLRKAASAAPSGSDEPPPRDGEEASLNRMNVPRGIRTLVATVKGWSPGPLDDGDGSDEMRVRTGWRRAHEP